MSTTLLHFSLCGKGNLVGLQNKRMAFEAWMQGEISSKRGKTLELQRLVVFFFKDSEMKSSWRTWKRSQKKILWFRRLSETGPPSLWLQGWAGTAVNCLCFHSTWHWLCGFWNTKLVLVWGRWVSNLMIISYRQLGYREKEVQMGRYRQGVTETIKELSKYLGRATEGIKVRNNSESCCLLQRSCRILHKYLPAEFEVLLMSCWKCAGSEK